MLRTTDGGKNWIFQGSIGGSAAYCVNSTVAYVMGIWSIHKTTDTGSTWTGQTSQLLVYGVSFTDVNNGWIVGNYGTILRTTNGGTDWTPQTSGTIEGLWDVTFTNANNGWIVGNGGTILRTSNGGTNWIQQTSGTVEGLWGITFTDANIGWIVGGGGTILRTTNGGTNWIQQTSGTIEGLWDVTFTNANNGWIVGNSGTILRTSNGGTNWIPQTSGTSNPLIGIYFIDALNGWAVGANGTILQTTNGGVPVELTSFTATANGKEVILNWSTATELNNQLFEVQRSFEGSDFATVGFVNGKGTTTERQDYSYSDEVFTNGKYSYKLKQIDYLGSYEYSDIVEIDYRAFNSYLLEQNFPNPFNPTTTIGFGLQNKSSVKIIILNSIGEEVAVVLNEERESGFHQVEFNASNLPSGVYFYQLKAGKCTAVKKMLLLK